MTPKQLIVYINKVIKNILVLNNSIEDLKNHSYHTVIDSTLIESYLGKKKSMRGSVTIPLYKIYSEILNLKDEVNKYD